MSNTFATSTHDLLVDEEHGTGEGVRHRQPSKKAESPSAQQEKLLAVRRSRGGYAGNVKRRCTQLAELIEGGADVNDIETVHEKIRAAYLDFAATNTIYIDLVTKMDYELAEDDKALDLVTQTVYDDALKLYANFRTKPENEVLPDDSISQITSTTTSRVSSASSIRTKAAAKRAALRAKVSSLKAIRQIEEETLQLEEEKRRTELQIEEEQRKIEEERRIMASRLLKEKRQMELELDMARKKMDIRRKELELQAELDAADAEMYVADRIMHDPEYLDREALSEPGKTFVYCPNDKLDHDNNEFDNVRVRNNTCYVNNTHRSSDTPKDRCTMPRVRDNSAQSETPVTKEPVSIRSNLNPLAPVWNLSQIQESPTRYHMIRSKPTNQNESYTQTDGNTYSGPSNQLNSDSQQEINRKLLGIMRLPKTTLMTFNGDPMEYWSFITAFDNTVDTPDVSSGDKLQRLVEYCTGKALKVIKPCLLMSPEDGYRKARELLQNRFGDDFVISNALVSRMVNGPPVKPNDGEALQDFVDDLRGCMETLKAMGKLTEVDTKDRIVKILTRLPAYLQARWRKMACKIRDKTGIYPGFDDFVTLLETVAREVNDPVFGNIVTGPRDSQNRGRNISTKRKGSSFNVNASVTPAQSVKSDKQNVGGGSLGPKCGICDKDNHNINQCNIFKKMDPKRRLSVIKEKKLCFNCLDTHFWQQCKKTGTCNENGCNRKHSPLLHTAFMSSPKNQTPDDSQRDVNNSPASTSEKPVEAKSYACRQSTSEYIKIALPIVQVLVRGKGQSEYITAHALLDSGSNKTFCSNVLLDRLGLTGNRTTMALETLTDGKETEAIEVSLEVKSTKKSKKFRNAVQLPRVYALSNFPKLKECHISRSDFSTLDHIKRLNMPPLDDSDVTILIGQDVPDALIPLEVRRGGNNEPYAVRTRLGWTLNGPMNGGHTQSVFCNFIQAGRDTDVSLNAQVEQFWKLDVGQNLACTLPQLSKDDRRVLEVWNDSIQLTDGHYEMDIPFKSSPPNLPENKFMAEKRLHSLGKRLLKDPELHERYKAGINDLIAKGYAEPINDIDSNQAGVWYLPHHSVLNPNKPEKIRIVFDCAAECGNTSLNKEVLQGPDMTNKLIGVLLRFREDQIAIMGDIEAMFHQVRVSPHHRDVLRFLWWKEGNPKLDPLPYRMTVHLFGGVWSPSCASFALRRTAEDHAREFDNDTIQTVLKNFYADDCLKSVPDVERARKLVTGLCSLLSLGGFRLTKWISNSKEVIESIPVEERAKEVKSLDLESAALPVERALGVQWDTETDNFSIKVKPKEVLYTRRGLLRIVSSVYDPLGFVCPFVLTAKMIFQDECKRNKGWDDELELSNIKKWSRWLSDLQDLEHFKIKRCYMPSDFGFPVSVQLHHFSDASQDAYGAVSYLRFVNDSGIVHCAFVLGKSRLAPIKYMTIPRLELSAAVLAVKIDNLLRKELNFEIEESVFWTDSMIVLQYIRNTTKRFQTFVANRVAVIHDGASPEQWRYVNTKQNPADDASRGLTANEILNKHRWSRGPDFLWEDESRWPVEPESSLDLLLDDVEIKKTAKVCAATTIFPDILEELYPRYSSWFRLKKAIAWLIRFAHWIGGKKPKDTRRLTVNELRNAEKGIIRSIQNNVFHDEINSLKSGKIPSRKSSIFKLEPFLDEENVMRVQGRLTNAPIADSAKHPAILPKDHHVSALVVRYVHEFVSGHSGREYVLSRIREHYWIPQGRPLINRVLRECVVCKKLRGKIGVQRMADLPQDRVMPGEPPFFYTGVDCFGPFYVKRGRSTEKRYGCLFTCLTTRAIHIEMLNSMDADSFVNALVRFISRRGAPKKIRSDNGTNFVGGSKELRDSISIWNKDHKTNERLLVRNIDWEFNPPAASHMGGVWERQIRTVRKILHAVLRNQTLDDERLSTLFCEIESIVNNRPLTTVSDDPKDMKPLTPNNLLQLGQGLNTSPGKFRKEDVYGRRWRHVQLLADQFWTRWVKEYLPSLQLRQKWLKTTGNLQTGSIVLILDEFLPRNNWPLGRVVKTFSGKDGLVRSVEVKTANSVLVRPINKLCLLESAED